MLRLLPRSAVFCACSGLLWMPSVGSAQSVVLVHGAGSNSSSWSSATRAQWQGSLPLSSIQYPDVWNAGGDLAWQAAHSVVPLIIAGQTAVVGYSKGGVLARQASASVAPKGIVTMASPNQGLPLANNLGWVLDGLNTMTWQFADLLLLSNLAAWYQPAPNWQILALQASAYGGAAYAQSGVSDALLSFLSNAEPYLSQFQVGSSFIQGLPVGGSNRYSIGSEQSAIASLSAPWSSIAGWSEAQASATQGATYALGWSAWNYAEDLYSSIDWGAWEGLLAFYYLGEAQSLASTVMLTPFIACVAVSTAGPLGSCLASDGLIPSWAGVYPQALHTTIAGPTHLGVQNSPVVNSLAISRAQTILGS